MADGGKMGVESTTTTLETALLLWRGRGRMFGKFQVDNAQPHFKRAHKKSRLGCAKCKERRVKVSQAPLSTLVHAQIMVANRNECDEVRPICDRCRLRGLDCQYQDWVPKGSFQVTESESSAGSNVSPIESSSTSVGTSSVEVGGESVSEADLAHHYLRHTCKTLALANSEGVQCHSWCAVVPALAVDSPAVKSGMLSLAACCMYTHTPREAEGDRAELLRAAYGHYNACLRESGLQLQKLDQAEYVDPIVATATILFALGLAFCQIERRRGKSLADAECWAWLTLLRGSSAVAKSIRESGADATLLHGLVMAPQSPCEPSNRVSSSDIRPQPLLDFLRRARPPSIFSLRKMLAETRHSCPHERYTQYSTSIDFLDRVFADATLLPQPQSFVRVIFTWPSKILSEIAEALTQGDKFALIIYAHWLMLTVVLEDLWIVGDMGRAQIFEIVARSAEWTEKEQEVLEWPKSVLSIR